MTAVRLQRDARVLRLAVALVLLLAREPRGARLKHGIVGVESVQQLAARGQR